MKRKILACVVACATLFLGMGYAFWTNSLQIDTTASTGELNVKFCDMAMYGQYPDENQGWAIFTGIPDNEFTPSMFFDRGDENNWNGLYNIIADDEALTAYKNDIARYTTTSFGAVLQAPITVVPAGSDGNVYGDNTNASEGIDVSITDMYPGYAQIFRTDIINIGTLAAKLADIKLDLKSNAEADVADMIGVSLKVITEDGASIKVLDTDDTDKYFTIDGVDFVRLSAINDLAITDGSGEDLLYIYPGTNTMDALFGVAMDPDYEGVYTTGHVGIDPASDNKDAKTQNKNVHFTIDFLWDQFNVAEPNGDNSIGESIAN